MRHGASRHTGHTRSGHHGGRLDIDALRIVSQGVNAMRDAGRSFLVITHYQRLLDHIVPDFVHVLSEGQIVKSGPKELALDLEAKGYDWLKEETA